MARAKRAWTGGGVKKFVDADGAETVGGADPFDPAPARAQLGSQVAAGTHVRPRTEVGKLANDVGRTVLPVAARDNCIARGRYFGSEDRSEPTG